MADAYEKELEMLYIELKEKMAEENSYIKNEKEIDEKFLSDLVMKKRILTDKIDKKSKSRELSNIAKIRILAIVKEMQKIEEENEKLYELKLDGIQKEIVSLINEKRLKDKYGGTSNESYFINEKK